VVFFFFFKLANNIYFVVLVFLVYSPDFIFNYFSFLKNRRISLLGSSSSQKCEKDASTFLFFFLTSYAVNSQIWINSLVDDLPLQLHHKNGRKTLAYIAIFSFYLIYSILYIFNFLLAVLYL
jgi:hypothetical protein